VRLRRGRGVGDLLVRAVEAWARSVHARTLELAVAEGNGPASALYQRHGFRRVSDASRPMPDGVRREYVMAKPLRGGIWHPMNMQSVYEAAGGSEGLLRLAEAWHSRVMADEVVGHAFSHGFHPQHTERLAAYWAEALGGPTTYSESYGDETSVVRMHSGNGIHEEMDQRAIACFDQALADAALTAEPLRQALHDYFAWATTTSMARYPKSADDVPDGMVIPRWSWDGLQR
jgi:hemoglobin